MIEVEDAAAIAVVVAVGAIILGVGFATINYPSDRSCESAVQTIAGHQACLDDSRCHATQQDFIDHAQAVDILKMCHARNWEGISL